MEWLRDLAKTSGFPYENSGPSTAKSKVPALRRNREYTISPMSAHNFPSEKRPFVTPRAHVLHLGAPLARGLLPPGNVRVDERGERGYHDGGEDDRTCVGERRHRCGNDHDARD